MFIKDVFINVSLQATFRVNELRLQEKKPSRFFADSKKTEQSVCCTSAVCKKVTKWHNNKNELKTRKNFDLEKMLNEIRQIM